MKTVQEMTSEELITWGKELAAAAYLSAHFDRDEKLNSIARELRNRGYSATLRIEFEVERIETVKVGSLKRRGKFRLGNSNCIWEVLDNTGRDLEIKCKCIKGPSEDSVRSFYFAQPVVPIKQKRI